MQVRKFLLTGIICTLSLAGFAQSKGTLSGHVFSDQSEALTGASVALKTSSGALTGRGVFTSEKGAWMLGKLTPGSYLLVVSFVGYQPVEKTVTITADEHHRINIILRPGSKDLETVSVIGRTEAKETSRLAYNVTAIDARQLHNTTLDLANVLDRVSGVRVRESGGVGSNFQFSLNGFTGRQVRFFIDGIPMDNFGSSFQLNNIPVNLADRIEVYKGVVPIWLGADALGGAVNIVTNPNRRNYLDVSYSYGSFNTHRSTINTGFTSKKGFTVQLNAFQNYSDNNYWVNVDAVPDLNTGLSVPMRVRRFHDNYRNETVIAHVGVVNQSWADRFLVGMTLGRNQADIQTGNRMYDVFGERRSRGNILMPSVRYTKKDVLTKGLSLTVSGNFNFGQEQAIDTAFKQYNWLGGFIYKGSHPGIPGGELSRTLYKFRNNNGLLNTTVSYQLSDRHSFVVNHTYNTFNRKGSDELNPDDEAIRQPKKTDKHVFGAGYKFDVGSRWNVTAFVKEYLLKSKSHKVLDNEYYVQQNTLSNQGYGIAGTWFVKPALQLKGSYEKSYRLPENDELFGDVIANLGANSSLRPESSHNFNIGANYTVSVNKVHQFYADANLIYRAAKDFIRPTLYNSFGRAERQMVNLRDVTNSGVDGEIRYSFKRLFTAGVTMTYQNIRNTTRYEGSTSVSPVYKDRIPNMPYLFGNANASLFLRNVGGPGNTLTIGYNLLYVHEYYLRWPSQGAAGSKLTIPEQLAHDANLVYSLKGGQYNVSVECRNLTDATLYDNFSLQKPSRSFAVKLRYFLQP